MVDSLTVRFVLNLQSLLVEWRLVFYLTFALYAVATIFYLIWGSGEVQPWNESPKAPEDIEAELKTTKTVENTVKFVSFLLINAIVLLLVTYI